MVADGRIMSGAVLDTPNVVVSAAHPSFPLANCAWAGEEESFRVAEEVVIEHLGREIEGCGLTHCPGY